METIISVVSASIVASVGCRLVLPCQVWLSLTRSGGGGRGPPPHVEHHCHQALVSRGAGESLSSVPTGLRPAVEN